MGKGAWAWGVGQGAWGREREANVVINSDSGLHTENKINKLSF
jgi:hypothetical protein